MTVGAPTGSSEGAPLPVTLVMRHPVPGWHSLETVFATVAAHLPPDITATVHVVPRRSTGLVARLVNLVDVWRLRRRPGVFHVTGDVQYLVLALPRRRTVLTVHDLGTLAIGGRLRRAVIALLWFHLPVRWAARTTVVSAATRDALAALIPARAAMLTVVSNPLPADLVPREPREPPARPTVLAVGATPNKNLARLAAAVAPLDVELVVVGDVPDDVRGQLAPVDPTARATLRTDLDLPRDDLLARYAAADVVALVSTSEGFGLPVIEAQAVGVPVVASDLPVLVDVAGGAARFVDPTDAAAIRAGLLEVLTDGELRARLVAAGRTNIARFEPAAIAAAYAAVHRAVGHTTAGGPGGSAGLSAADA